MSSVKMGPGSPGGHPGSRLQKQLITVGLLGDQVYTVSIYMSDPDGLISSEIRFRGLQPPKQVHFICQFIVFQVADQRTRPLATCSDSGGYW